MDAAASTPAGAVPTHEPKVTGKANPAPHRNPFPGTWFGQWSSQSHWPGSQSLRRSHQASSARFWAAPSLGGKCSFSVCTIPGTCGRATLPPSTSHSCKFPAEVLQVQFLECFLRNNSSQVWIGPFSSSSLWSGAVFYEGKSTTERQHDQKEEERGEKHDHRKGGRGTTTEPTQLNFSFSFTNRRRRSEGKVPLSSWVVLPSFTSFRMEVLSTQHGRTNTASPPARRERGSTSTQRQEREKTAPTKGEGGQHHPNGEENFPPSLF